MTDRARETSRELMTIGELAQRTGLSIRSIREYEGLGLIYSAGRSPGDYRLFDQSALWCAQVIRNLRSLGLTIKEIERLAGLYLSRPQEPIGPHLAALLERAEHRIGERLTELESIRRRIQDFRSEHAAALAGDPEAGPFADDPRRRSEGA